MKGYDPPYCGQCTFFIGEDTYGIGYCKLQDYKESQCDVRCSLDHAKMRREDTLQGLHELQKWRRGGKVSMPQPYVIGKLIDSAIHRLRNDVVYD